MRRILQAVGLVIIVVAAVVIYRTENLPSQQVPVVPIDPIDIDEWVVAGHLSELIQFKTLSRQVKQDGDELPFLAVHEWLAVTYPKTFATLKHQPIGDLTLLFKWQGSDPDARPILWTGHMDVVPVEAGTEELWTHPPFSGKIADGHIWGRGAVDMKSTVIAMMEAIEHLAGSGYQPKRTLYLALTHDEEVGGLNGAAAVTAHLKQADVQMAWSLDEGGLIGVGGLINGIDEPVGLIAVGEKGWITLKITAKSGGGHSSVPIAGDLAIVNLSKALVRLDESQFPAKLNGAPREMMLSLAPALPYYQRVALANLWLFEPLVVAMLESSPVSAAMLRTTIAPTMVEGSPKENILPQRASAFVNFRVHPNDTMESVLAHVERAVADPKIEVSQSTQSFARDASPMASKESAGYKLIAKTIGDIYGSILVSPGMTVGGTDSKHYQAIADETYRFAPMTLPPSDARGFHGTNERVRVANMDDMVRFYIQLMKNADEDR